MEQNEEILQQKEEILAQTEKLGETNKELSKRNKQILDSIVYAKRIQNTIIPDEKFFNSIFPKHFIYYKPRDIVSGDFYWLKRIENKILLAVSDCTGHGVPGAFMSIIGHNLLEQISSTNLVCDPAEILNLMRELLTIKFLDQSDDNEDIEDGMDIALCCIDKEKKQIVFSGALQTLIQISNNNIEEYVGNNCPIGKTHEKAYETFINYTINYNEGDKFYLFSDGFADQFGGSKSNKFYYNNFKKLLFDTKMHSMNKQGEILSETMKTWMYGHRQIDDIL
ncbi:MAG: hypothetical protein C0594_07185, partial [Marinilabiliales bacterium]